MITRRRFIALATTTPLALLLARQLQPTVTQTLRGVPANDIGGLATMNLDWCYVDYAYVGDLSLYPCEVVCQLNDLIPIPASVQRAYQYPNCSKWVLAAHNEPDLNGVEPQTYVNTLVQQMDVWLNVNPNSYFCIGGVSQLGGFDTATPYFPAVWNLVPASLKPYCKGYHRHEYPTQRWGQDALHIYNKAPLRQTFKADRDWLNSEGIDRLWVTEIGLANGAVVDVDPRTVTFPTTVNEVANEIYNGKVRVNRWAWFPYWAWKEPEMSYAELRAPDFSLTPTGVTFANLG